MDPLEHKIRLLLTEMPLEDLLEHCDVTPEEAVRYLVDAGFLELPEWTPEM